MAGRMCIVVITCISILITMTMADSNDTASSAQQDNTVSDTGSYEKTSLEKGVTTLYDKIMHGFIDATIPGQFFSDADQGPITYKDLNRIIQNGTYGELQDRWQDLSKVFGGLAACIIIGLLFILFMPIFGCIWCCAFCCCKTCGKAKSKMDPKRAKCQRVIFATLLFAFTTFMLAGSIVSIISNEILHEKLRNVDNKGPVGMLEGSFSKLEVFAIDTVKEIEQAGSSTLDRTVDGVVSRIRGATESTIEEVKKTINAETLLTDAERLGRDASAVLTDLNKVTTTLDVINDLNKQITATLDSVKTSLNTTCTDNSIPVATCPSINVNAGTDFSGVQSLVNETTKMQGAQGIINETQTARAEFDNLQKNLTADINNEIDNAVNQSREITQQVSGQLNTVNETVEPFVNSINSNVQPQLKDLDNYLKEYGDYWWYAGIAIPCVIVLAVVFYFLGIMFGTFGDRPGDGAQCCNKGAASNLLVCGVVWSFLFASILMLVVLILFLLGGGMYGIMCRDINKGVENIQLYEPVVDEILNVRISKLLYGDNAPANLTLGSILSDCKENKALYTAVKLKHLFDLDTLLNTTEITDKIDSVMSDTLPNIGSITIIPTGLQNQLGKFSDSGVDTINFTQYTDQLNKAITTSPLDDAIATLRSSADNLVTANETAAAESLRNQSDILVALKDEEVANMTMQFNQLQAVLTHLQGYTDIQNRTTGLINGLQKAQDDFNNNSTRIVKQMLEQVTRNISLFVQTEIDSIKAKIENDIGRCQPLYAATQQASDSFCLVALDPFNGFWFGLGWGLSAFLFCIVFALCLASLYQREEPYDKFLDMRRKKDRHTQELDSPDMEMYQGQAGYNAYGHQDNVPLTSMEAGYQKGGRGRGVPNAAYDNGQQQDPYLRNEAPGSKKRKQYY